MFRVAGITNIEHTADSHDNISGRPPCFRLPLVIPIPKSKTSTSELNYIFYIIYNKLFHYLLPRSLCYFVPTPRDIII